MSLDGVQSLPLPCSHGVVASFEAKRIMIIMIYDILRLTILSSHSLPKPGCMLVYYRFPKMPSMFTSMSNVMPNKSSHVCFSHILHSYISLLIFRPIMTQWEKMFAQRSWYLSSYGSGLEAWYSSVHPNEKRGMDAHSLRTWHFNVFQCVKKSCGWLRNPAPHLELGKPYINVINIDKHW